MSPRIRNLTPHQLVVFHGDGEQYVIPPDGTVARARSSYERCENLLVWETVRCVYGQIDGLPEPEEGVLLIVSGLVFNVLGGSRPDVLAPDTGPTAVRDQHGNIVGVRRFLRG